MNRKNQRNRNKKNFGTVMDSFWLKKKFYPITDKKPILINNL